MNNLKNIPCYAEAFRLMVSGKSVMPVGKDKKPLLASWKALQTRLPTEEELAEWWTKWPDANIGLITGTLSGVTVVDIDTSGEQTVSLDTFPPTLTHSTPSGGFHLIYLYDEQIKQTANTFPQFPHVDIRSDGGFIVWPPSRAQYIKNHLFITGAYKVLKALAVVPFPTALFITTAPKKNPKVDAILKGFPTMAEGDGRNVALTKVVGKILKLVRPPDHESVAWPLALATNSRFKKPLDESEVRVIFNSISAKEKTKPLADIDFIRGEKGAIIANVENVFRTLQADPNLTGRFRLNTFAGVVETNYEHAWLAFQRSDVIRIRGYLMSTYGHFQKIGHTEVEDAMVSIAEQNKVSPPAQWLTELTWDKTARLDEWLSSTYGVESNEYHRAVGSNMLKGIVKRVIQPGCKFDYVLVLEGKQGIRKSTSLAILGGDWHVETVFTPDNKDFFMLFAGNMIVEFSEGETLSRTEAKKLKAVITMQHDKFRPPYERSAKDFPRQCVFAMTTNQEQYLKDETGNRRWLPIAIKGRINTEWLQENRDQLFAEAYHRAITLKETVHEFPEQATADEQRLRQISDPRQELIEDWYYNVLDDEKRAKGVTTRQVFLEVLEGGFGTGVGMERGEEMVIASILRDGLLLDKRRESVRGVRFYLFFPTPASEANKPDPSEKTKVAEPSPMRF